MKRLIISAVIVGCLLGITGRSVVYGVEKWQDFGLAGDTARLDATKIIRNAAILTTDWVAGTVQNVSQYGQLCININFTKGDLTDMLLKIETSDASAGTYFAEAVEATSGDGYADISTKIWRFATSGSYAIRLPINAKYIKISVKGEGTVTGSSCAITLAGGWGN